MKTTHKVTTLVWFAITASVVSVAAQDIHVNLGPVKQISADRPNVPHAETHLVVHPDDPNQMIVGAIVMPDGEEAAVEVMYTVDGGDRWTRNSLPRMSDTWGADPWLAFDGLGRPVVSALVGTGPEYRAGIWIYSADSLGADWRSPIHVGPGDGGSWDAQKIVIDTRRGTNGGTLIMVGDKWGPVAAGGNRTASVGLAWVLQGGRGLARVGHAEQNNASKSPSAPVVLRDGSVVTLFHEYLSMANVPAGWIGGLWSIASSDGGQTFEHRNIIAKDLRPGMIALAADTLGDQDRLYALWPSTAGGIHVSTSDTRGERWTAPTAIGPLAEGDVPGTYSAVDGRGVFGAIWNVEGPSTDGVVCRDTWFAASRDGAAFTEPVKLQEGESCVVVADSPTFTVDGNVNRTYDRYARGGEYFGLAGLPDGGFYAIWIDATTGEQQMMGRRIDFETQMQ